MSDQLQLLIRAGYPLISIETLDEPRAVEVVRKAAETAGRHVWEWSIIGGLQVVDGDRETAIPLVEPGKVMPVLEYLRDELDGTVVLFKDLGPHAREARVWRMLRELQEVCRRTRSTMILVDALPLPEELARFAIRFEVPCPTAEELEQVVRRTVTRIHKEALGGIEARMSRRDLNHLVQMLRGLSCEEAERVVAGAIYDDWALTAEDLPRIIESKRAVLGSAGSLEAVAADFSPEDIGGLDRLKQWLALRRHGFSRRARQFGLEPPRGVLMLGVQGCGKSLCAKVVAADWKLPLLRLDPGMLYQKYVGESESQLRRALRQAEAMAPCVLWIDEIEKAFASASTPSADGGLSQRMFATLLTWMQDHRHPIFIVATANDISALPPELMRKGRFDEVFFVDLPTAAARAEILAIHLRRRRRNPGEFDLERLAAEAEGFSGAELEQAVIAALFQAFAAGRELSSDDLSDAIRATQPLSVVMAERIAALREWARDRCVPAD